jgi:hypothetical protein
MEVIFIGANRRHGISKSGNPYDISKFVYAVPLKEVSREGMEYIGCGGDVREMDIKPEAISAFSSCKIGQTVKVRLEPKPENPNRNWVVGLA